MHLRCFGWLGSQIAGCGRWFHKWHCPMLQNTQVEILWKNSFHRISGESPKFLPNWTTPQDFHTLRTRWNFGILHSNKTDANILMISSNDGNEFRYQSVLVIYFLEKVWVHLNLALLYQVLTCLKTYKIIGRLLF